MPLTLSYNMFFLFCLLSLSQSWPIEESRQTTPTCEQREVDLARIQSEFKDEMEMKFYQNKCSLKYGCKQLFHELIRIYRHSLSPFAACRSDVCEKNFEHAAVRFDRMRKLFNVGSSKTMRYLINHAESNFYETVDVLKSRYC